MEDMHEYMKEIAYILIVDNDPAIGLSVSEYFSDHNV